MTKDLISYILSYRKIDKDLEVNDLTTAKKVSESDKLTKFIEDHCTATTYTYQIKKCGDCDFCQEHPVRSPIKDLNFVPAPLLDDTRQHYVSFEELYGKKPDEKDLPSLKYGLDQIEEDKV